MGLFGPAKIRITPREFVRAQLDSLFSAAFAGQHRGQFLDLAKGVPLLRRASPEAYAKEKQNVVFNLLQLAWDRNTPYAAFIESSSIMLDDPRVKAVNSGVYDRCLSRAQEAGMDTFGFIAMVFLSQLLPEDIDKGNADFARLYEACGTEFTGLYLSYEALIKRYKFVA